MMPILGRCAGWSRLAVGVGLLVGLLSTATAAAGLSDDLLSPTPLVLKDGRIARVSVHVVPFDQGASQVTTEIATRLTSLTGEIATDCFLTAQVIGHVGPTEVAESETMEVHRLARSRADVVQESLIAAGLPAKSIASVWDWQFMVRDKRATLWVFRLTEGEDCEGSPLSPAAPALVAEADTTTLPSTLTSPSTSTPPSQAPSQVAEPEWSEGSATDATPVLPPAAPAPRLAATSRAEAAEPAAGQTTSPLRAQQDSVPAGPAPKRAIGPTVTQPLPASQRAQRLTPSDATAPSDATTTAAIPTKVSPESERDAGPGRDAGEIAPERDGNEVAPEQAVAAVPPASAPAAGTTATGSSATVAATESSATGATATRVAATASSVNAAAEGGVRHEPDDALVITFATNSSYFPPGARQELVALVKSLAAGGRYDVHLRASVSSSDQITGAASTEEAARYNQWLAERRVDRIKTWLDEHALGSELAITTDFLPDDDSRQIILRLDPTG